MKSYKFIVFGKVQGVYYRVNIKKNASQAGFRGYVRNLSDGTVEACVTCKEENLQKFIGILKRGSRLSKVTQIKKFTCHQLFSKSFEVR